MNVNHFVSPLQEGISLKENSETNLKVNLVNNGAETILKSGRKTKSQTWQQIYLTVFTVCVLLFSTQNIFAQFYQYGFNDVNQTLLIDGKKINCAIVISVYEHFPASEAGLIVGDVIVAIDGKPPQDVNLSQKANCTFSIKRFGNQDITLNVAGLPFVSNNYMAEIGYAYNDIIGQIYGYVTQKTLDIEPINIMSDPDVEFFKYKSFDFEFVGENIMQQKEIAPEIEAWLANKKLIRNKEKPDILIFIEFYSDRREQYVPPSQRLATRYGTVYNYWTKQYETRQYVETHQSGNYTNVNYLSKLSISMADAKKLSKGEIEKAKIWQADYEVLYSKKAEHKQFASAIVHKMLWLFPFKIKMMAQFYYFYTGIIYDKEIAGRVVGIVPNSPAARAGIKAGDIIQSSSWGSKEIFKKSFNKLSESIENLKTYHWNYEDFALTRASANRYEDYKYNSPFQNTYMSCYEKRKNEFNFDEISHGVAPLILKVKSEDGSTKKIALDPIKTRCDVFIF